MKRKVLAMLLAGGMVLGLAACGSETGGGDTASEPKDAPMQTETPAASEESEEEAPAGELVDGKFAETRKITVEVYDRGIDGGSDVTNNMYTEYIKKGMLEDHNVEVEFVKVPRWTEDQEINNLLAAGDAPDICLTYSYPTIKTYAEMGGVLDLSGYLEQYKEYLPNMWEWLTDDNIYWNQDPDTGELWAIESKLAVDNRILTFIRRDWVEKLGMEMPTTTEEFEALMVAFRDNAETLLGADADKMVPYSISYDVGWRAANLIESYIDCEISDRDYYVYGFDDRKFTMPGTKEAVRLLNKWYNDKLIWQDFAIYGAGDTTEDNMIKAGYVGAFTHNWDYPYRNGEDSINANLKRMVGEEADFVAVDCFQDKNGTYTKFVPGPVDRKIFFPTTNEEPLASLLYLDWISDPEHVEYLQLGDEGVTHEVLESGAVATIAATGDAIQNSGFNIDYTITVNGLKLVDPEKTKLSRAYSYAAVDPELITIADTLANTDKRIGKNVNVGNIEAENGMGPALVEKRDIVFDTAVVAPVEEFDAVWDAGMEDYLASGGQAIMDERAEKWTATFGDTDTLPE